MSVPTIDRRTSVRVGKDILLRTVSAKGDAELCVAMDLSEKGIFVEQVLPHAEGTVLDVEFALPGVGRVATKAKVVSAKKYLPADLKGRTGNGLQFQNPSPTTRVLLRRFMEQALGITDEVKAANRPSPGGGGDDLF